MVTEHQDCVIRTYSNIASRFKAMASLACGSFHYLTLAYLGTDFLITHAFECTTSDSIIRLEMSRHKLVKGLDLAEELDVYDGADDDIDEEQEELAPEDKEHLRRGTTEVRSTLGSDFPATDKEIEDSLYYYYYDIQKTVNYLLSRCRPFP